MKTLLVLFAILFELFGNANACKEYYTIIVSQFENVIIHI